MPIGRLLGLASLSAVCVIAFSTPVFADGVYRFTDRPESVFDKPIYFFTDTDSLLFGGHASTEFATCGSSKDHWNRLGDFNSDQSKGRGNYFDCGYGDGGWNFRDKDWDNDGRGGKRRRPGTGGIGGNPTVAVPEPTALVLLSAALAAFLLKSLGKAMGLIRA